MNLFPLCTAIVWPTKSGEITDALAHVFKTDFLLVSFNANTFFSILKSIKGPFFNERLIIIPLFIFSYVLQYTCWKLFSSNGFYNPSQEVLCAILDVHLTTCLLHHPLGDLQDSSRHHVRAVFFLTTLSDRLYPIFRGCVLYFQPYLL